MAEKKILIVDDEDHIRELLKFNLEKNGYVVYMANDGLNGLKLAREKQVDLILLDLMLPGMDGFEVCKEIRRDNIISNVPIIMLTAKSEEIDKILGLELGADDYITKPFSIRELSARIKALLRRSNVKYDNEILRFGNITLNLQTREVLKHGKKLDFTLKEFEVLKLLIQNKGKILTREILLDKIWGYEYVGETRTVDVHIRHIRKKIEEDDKKPIYIQTIRGVGYKFIGDVL
ncbi:MAG: response regulator transcription factor [Sarcina ventriculi]|uniref:Stage 0 sporulation protein A homolog n=1 Tax=Sarcina ventriculi TaxID=1267 RepID=A0ABP2AQY7_SARVE|nr:response regulator transcription factor [Sarcina ventriculi]MDO4402094.1 response regulator transcription factor [Clostridiaceae bacterium]MBU5322656.1 response regulator transcription factor [Sarcina ventriculi]MCI5635843.1 response regulator transcription factor [Sarcina ventriculi]MDD7372690.1 response regulator transcription factor [Sarcina ventriculi]MDY7062274.1 response regulator transcription factor [Sarcina ventriculi]